MSDNRPSRDGNSIRASMSLQKSAISSAVMRARRRWKCHNLALALQLMRKRLRGECFVEIRSIIGFAQDCEFPVSLHRRFAVSGCQDDR